MAREHAKVRGRDQDLSALREALIADTGRLVVLRGPAGIGRSSVIAAAARRLAADGLRVIQVPLGTDPEPDDCDDRYGIGRTLRSIREQFEEFGDVRLADSLNAVVRLWRAPGRDPQWWAPRMASELAVMFHRISRTQPTVLLADDVHTIADPALLLTAARRSGCAVLVSCPDDAPKTPGLAELLAVADQVLTLAPLADDHVTAMIDAATGAPADESVPAALRIALGELFGHPGSVLATLAELRAAGRLVPVRDRVCLRGPDEPITLPADHYLVRRADELGPFGPLLLGVVAAWDGFGVDDLPLLTDAIGEPLADCGEALDLLITAGVLMIDESDRLSCRCPALAAFARARLGADGSARLHAAIAATLLQRRRAGEPVHPATLADHVADGGMSLVLDEETAAQVSSWLMELAATTAQDQPERAARWYAAVLRRCRPEEPRHAEVLAILLRIVLRTGQYELLGDVLGAHCLEGAILASRADVHLAAVLAVMHTETPVCQPVVDALLAQSAPDGTPVGFAAWWFGHRLGEGGVPSEAFAPMVSDIGLRHLLSTGQADLLLAALSGDPAACSRAWQRMGWPDAPQQLDWLYESGGRLDLASALRFTFGKGYRIPRHGVLGAYRRALHSYVNGQWSNALSAVRELDMTGSGDTVLHHAGRLIAAEINAGRGQYDTAAQCLAAARPVPALAGVRAWIELGVLRCATPSAEDVRTAHQHYRRLRDSGLRVGVECLLLRSVELASALGEQDLAVELLAEIEELHRSSPSPATMETMFLARGLAHRDMVYSQAGIDLARRRRHSTTVLSACLAAAEFAPDPQALLNEAYELARECDSPLFREHVRALVRQRGAAVPRVRAHRGALSATQQRIVDLLRDCLTNRQIAAELGISEKTVETHLTRLFTLTGCRSRVELTAASLGGRLLELAS